MTSIEILERLKANIHRKTEYYRTATHDPYDHNVTIYSALFEMETAIKETISDIESLRLPCDHGKF